MTTDTEVTKPEITLDKAVRKYLELRTEAETIEKSVKAQVAAIKEKMGRLEAWITEKADAEGLGNVKIAGVGTAMWTVHYSATVASRDAFFDFVRENNAFDMLENRVSKTAVRAYIDAHGEVPPGVNFGSYRAFSVRKENAVDAEQDAV